MRPLPPPTLARMAGSAVRREEAAHRHIGYWPWWAIPPGQRRSLGFLLKAFRVHGGESALRVGVPTDWIGDGWIGSAVRGTPIPMGDMGEVVTDRGERTGPSAR
ncbi:hypothetical protein GZL_08592 [Streptomyces sp. 769]|nr:hypothetical protein GZL_08592 [Streptomyces sp. 769]